MGSQALSPSPETEATIRPAGPADTARLADLCGQLGYPTAAERVEERLAQIEANERRRVYVAEVGGAVVGWVYVYLVPSLLHDPQAEIGGLIVSEGYRGQRIGERLLRQAEQWAGEHGCHAVSVHSNVIRKDAHRFYERLGYRAVKTQLALCHDLESRE